MVRTDSGDEDDWGEEGLEVPVRVLVIGFSSMEAWRVETCPLRLVRFERRTKGTCGCAFVHRGMCWCKATRTSGSLA